MPGRRAIMIVGHSGSAVICVLPLLYSLTLFSLLQGTCYNTPANVPNAKQMIKVKQLSKRYGSLVAVDNLSFEVQPGEVLGFLGPNGAGKSTTMKMITGFLEPTSGDAEIFGHSIRKSAVAAKRITGYLPEGAPVYGEMNVLEFLKFVTSIRGMKSGAARKATDDVIEKLELSPVVNKPIDTLSKGFKRRVGLAQTLVHDPRVLIMDEPTDGLDPNQKHQVRSLIRSLTSEKIVVISTHILEEVDAVCSRALIISNGKLLIDDTPANLLKKSRYHNAVSLIPNPENPEEVIGHIKSLREVGAVETNRRSKRVYIFPKHGENLYNLISTLVDRGRIKATQLRLEEGKLDEVFREITSGAVS